MARNAIESDFRTSKMGAGGHFVKKKIYKKFHIDLKCPEMRSKVNFGHPKVPYRSEMARNAIESEFRTSKMAAAGLVVAVVT